MQPNIIVHNLAQFVEPADFNDLSAEAVKQLKIRLLDSLRRGIWCIKKPLGTRADV